MYKIKKNKVFKIEEISKNFFNELLEASRAIYPNDDFESFTSFYWEWYKKLLSFEKYEHIVHKIKKYDDYNEVIRLVDRPQLKFDLNIFSPQDIDDSPMTDEILYEMLKDTRFLRLLKEGYSVKSLSFFDIRFDKDDNYIIIDKRLEQISKIIENNFDKKVLKIDERVNEQEIFRFYTNYPLDDSQLERLCDFVPQMNPLNIFDEYIEIELDIW